MISEQSTISNAVSLRIMSIESATRLIETGCEHACGEMPEPLWGQTIGAALTLLKQVYGDETATLIQEQQNHGAR